MRGLVLLAELFAFFAHASAWNYGTNGPSTWAASYSTCGGSNQSPINVVGADAEYEDDLTLTPSGYDTGYEWDLENNGHSVVANLPSDNVGNVSLVANDLYDNEENTWYLLQFHFHWDENNTAGSENTVDGEQFPLEVHLVHYNSKYASSNASYNDDGLLVLAFLFEIGSANSAMNKITNKLDEVPYDGNTTATNSLAVSDILPSGWSSDQFYSWKGSLTTPGCSEAVSWYLFKDPLTISQAQINKFRNNVHENAPGESAVLLEKNWRPTQNLNGRTVYTNVDTSGARAATYMSATLLVAMVMSVIY